MKIDEKFNIWEGIYKSFASAREAGKGTGFGGDVYLTRSKMVATECVTALNSKRYIPQFHKQRSNLLPVIVAMLNKKKISILDFGGGLGIGYMTLVESIPDAMERIEYTIVEVEKVSDLAKELLFKQKWNIKYENYIPDIESYDIVHAASSMQYVEDYKEWIVKLTSVKAEHILLSDVFAGEIETYVTLQNYYGSRIPHWFFNLNEIIGLFKKCGYQLAMKSTVSSRRLNQIDILPMENFPQSHQIEETLHLLFEMKN